MPVFKATFSSVGNPDYGQYTPQSPRLTVTARSIEALRELARAYKEKHNLGGGNWVDPAVYRDGQRIGRMSYNERLWDADGKEIYPHKAAA